MSDHRRSDPHDGKGPATSSAGRKKAPKAPTRSKAGDVGKALRTVYDSTLREQVPDDFLDLLGKLR